MTLNICSNAWKPLIYILDHHEGDQFGWLKSIHRIFLVNCIVWSTRRVARLDPFLSNILGKTNSKSPEKMVVFQVRNLWDAKGPPLSGGENVSFRVDDSVELFFLRLVSFWWRIPDMHSMVKLGVLTYMFFLAISRFPIFAMFRKLWLSNQPPPNVPAHEVRSYDHGLLTIGWLAINRPIPWWFAIYIYIGDYIPTQIIWGIILKK